jgi:hypothetical protein
MTVVKDPQYENEVESIRKEVRSMAARKDIDGLTSLPKETLEVQRGEAQERLETRSNRRLDEDRSYTDREEQLSKADMAEIEAIDAALVLQERNAAQGERVQERLRQLADVTDTRRNRDTPTNPLAVTGEMLNGVQATLETRTAGWFDVETRAALTTTTYGSPRDWGANILDAPRTLWETAGIKSERAQAVFAQFPKLTLPATDAGVGEGVSVVEFAASTGGTVTLKRYGRYTDFTRESLVGADAGAVIAAHRTAIARDLDSALIGLVNTDAGGAVAFTADVPAAIRKSIATVVDNTASPDGRIVVLAHPDNVALLQNVTSTGGQTIGEDFPRFAGAIVYASSAVRRGSCSSVTWLSPAGSGMRAGFRPGRSQMSKPGC